MHQSKLIPPPPPPPLIPGYKSGLVSIVCKIRAGNGRKCPTPGTTEDVPVFVNACVRSIVPNCTQKSLWERSPPSGQKRQNAQILHILGTQRAANLVLKPHLLHYNTITYFILSSFTLVHGNIDSNLAIADTLGIAVCCP